MAGRKAFLLRLEPGVHDALQRWADSDMRSVNAQIEFLLRRALRDAGRLPNAEPAGDETHAQTQGETTSDDTGNP